MASAALKSLITSTRAMWLAVAIATGVSITAAMVIASLFQILFRFLGLGRPLQRNVNKQ
jgi:hypothetical protein